MTLRRRGCIQGREGPAQRDPRALAWWGTPLHVPGAISFLTCLNSARFPNSPSVWSEAPCRQLISRGWRSCQKRAPLCVGLHPGFAL